MLTFVSVVFAITLLFRPTFMEFFWVYIVVDSLSVTILGFLFVPVFNYYVPDSKLFFFGVDHEVFSKLSQKERIHLLESMMKFPKQYAAVLYFTSFIKAAPVFLLVVFYWQHETSNFIQFILVLIFSAVCYFYFYGCALFDAHAKINIWIEDLHKKFNLTSEFENLQIPSKPENLHFQEILVQVFIILFVLTLQALIILSKQYSSPTELVFKISTVGIIGLALFTRIWYLGRQEILGGLAKIMEHMNSVDLNQNTISLPLHSSSFLASFEKTFNLLESRIISSERKLRGLVFQESEKSRFHALGEMSGLIAHDLSAPLHAIQYCYNEISEQNIPEEMLPYVQHMGPNIMQSIELVSALRARLKNTRETVIKSEFSDAYEFVIRLLEIQFSAKLFDRIKIDLDPKVAILVLAVPRVDLMQILDNLFRNSIKNLTSANIEKPVLKIDLVEIESEFAKIRISDNGSGLSVEEFNLMTDENQIIDVSAGVSRSLGLRLTRRLVEHYGGTLTLFDSNLNKLDNKGTKFCLCLKLFKNG
jgi:signal transduction histidine kinase